MAIVDFAIVTALVEEFEILKKVLPNLRERSENGNIWYRSAVRANNGKQYQIVAAVQDQMGTLAAQELATRLIDRWDPAYILLVGIAGSFASNVQLGDVIVSQQIFYYDLAKATAEGLQIRPEGYPGSSVLIRQLEAFRLDPRSLAKWRKAAQNSAARKASKIRTQKGKGLRAATNALRKHSPEIHFGTISSGSLVVADKRKQEELLKLHGKIIGTEMEGAGIMHAAFFHRELPTPAIVIKGISDTSNKDKDRLDELSHWRELAKENSARLSVDLIRRGATRELLTDQFSVSIETASPALARKYIPDASAGGVAFIAWPKLLIPKGPLTELHLCIDAKDNIDQLTVRKAVLEYRARDGHRVKMVVELSNAINIEQLILPDFVSLYLMLDRPATHVVFSIRTSGGDVSEQWKA